MAKRVFFSFHYQDVIDFRANVVRQHWMTKPDRESAGFFDASIWGNAKLSGDTSVKRLINSGLAGTSVTCVLVGSQTYSRKWVRYEILSSIRKGNYVIAVHINSIKGRDRMIKPRGLNPLDHLGISFSDSGLTATLWENTRGRWNEYNEINGRSSYLTDGVEPQYCGRFFTIAHLSEEYDWVADDGYNNFSSWIH